MFKTDAVLHTIDKVYFYNRQSSAYNQKSKCLLTNRVVCATDRVNVSYNWQSGVYN